MLVNQIYQGGIRALLDYDPTIFDYMTLPDDLDQDVVYQMIIDRIIFDYGDAPLFCPDPAVMKYYIGEWSFQRSPIWKRYYDAVTKQYDPLENYDRHEQYDTTFYPGSTLENQLSADNATTYQADRKTVTSGKDKTNVVGRVHGNIGVTTSQQMLKAEIDLMPIIDVIKFIADDWHQEFNLMMYN